MRSAMRTVEKRCEIKSAIFPAVSSAKRWKTSNSLRASSAAVGSSRIQKLRVAQIGARQCNFLPLSAGKIDAGFEAPAQHLIVTANLRNHRVCQALPGGGFEQFQIVNFLNPAHCNVFTRRHLIAHKVLKDNANLTIQVFQTILFQVHPVEQHLAFGGIVKPRDQLDDRGLALTVLADQRNPLPGMKMEVQPIQHQPRASRIAKRNIAKFKSANDRPRRRKRIRLGPDGGLHVEEGQQVGQEKSLVRDARNGGENLLDVGAGLQNRARQQVPQSKIVHAGDRPPDYEHIGRVISHESDHGKESPGDQFPPGQGDVLFVDPIREFGETLREELLSPNNLSSFAASLLPPTWRR